MKIKMTIEGRLEAEFDMDDIGDLGDLNNTRKLVDFNGTEITNMTVIDEDGDDVFDSESLKSIKEEIKIHLMNKLKA